MSFVSRGFRGRRRGLLRGANAYLFHSGARAHARGDARVRGYPPPRGDHGGGAWSRVTFSGEMTLPDGNVIAPTGKAFDVEFAQTNKWVGDELIIISAFWDAALQAKELGLAP